MALYCAQYLNPFSARKMATGARKKEREGGGGICLRPAGRKVEKEGGMGQMGREERRTRENQRQTH